MRTSAGILLYRRRGEAVEVLLVHPGGPFWARRDDGAWSIPKGEYGPGEEPLACALREFEEETGTRLEAARPLSLGPVRLKSGKRIEAWAVEGDLDPETIRSNTFELEWPRGSGRMRSYPEVDRAGWFVPDEARRKLNPAQVDLLERLLVALRQGGAAPAS